MTELMCFNHEYPLSPIEKGIKCKKNILGRVTSLEKTVYCPICGMEIVYSFKVHSYKKGEGVNGR